MKHTNVLISLCLVLAVSAVIAYVYIGPKGIWNTVSEMLKIKNYMRIIWKKGRNK